MPLLVDGKEVKEFDDLEIISGSSSTLQMQRNELKRTPLKIIGPNDFSLYVGQNEYATVKPGTGSVKIIGSDEATTCHILAIRHSGSGVITLGHLDGSFIASAVKNMMKSLLELSKGSPEGRLEMHLIGGFLDERGLSAELTSEIMSSILSLQEAIHLLTFCTTSDNDFIKDQLHFPILTGIGVEINSGKIFPAEFTTKGPDLEIRSAANHVNGQVETRNIFRNGCIEIGPFFWYTKWYGHEIVGESDEFFRKNFSTSPEQESKYFADHMRASLKVLADHPESAKTLFKDGRARVYRLSGRAGCWERVHYDDP